MKKIKDKEIYPRFEFRLTHEQKDWLTKELAELKEKFRENDHPVSNSLLLIAALKHGVRRLKTARRLSDSVSMTCK